MSPLEKIAAPASSTEGRRPAIRPAAVRHRRSRLPAHFWLWASAASMIVGLTLQRSRNRKTRRVAAIIRGWASPLLTLGISDLLGLRRFSGRDRATARATRRRS